MELLNRASIVELLRSTENSSLFIDPLLEESQIGDVTIDLRLGYDFLVSILTRNPYIELAKNTTKYHRGTASYFQETRREIGDKFVLYPGQVVLSTTVEYICLPPNVFADILSRSSYTRLGIHINTMVQPGFRGCFPLELFNHGNNAIELVVGSRICQSRLFRSKNNHEYYQNGVLRKYYGNIRPIASRAHSDTDLAVLENIARQR